MRTTRPQMFMDIARVVACRSTCMRLNVGAVLVSGRSIVSIGYNGAPAGAPHCLGNSCPGRQACYETTHAEANALDHLPVGVGGPLDLYVTDSPCVHCFERIVTDGRISRIFFGTPYRVSDHLKASKEKYGLPVYRVLPAGYILEWDSQELVDVHT